MPWTEPPGRGRVEWRRCPAHPRPAARTRARPGTHRGASARPVRAPFTRGTRERGGRITRRGLALSLAAHALLVLTVTLAPVRVRRAAVDVRDATGGRADQVSYVDLGAGPARRAAGVRGPRRPLRARNTPERKPSLGPTPRPCGRRVRHRRWGGFRSARRRHSAGERCGGAGHRSSGGTRRRAGCRCGERRGGRGRRAKRRRGRAAGDGARRRGGW
jgi:hypothetical protein